MSEEYERQLHAENITLRTENAQLLTRIAECEARESALKNANQLDRALIIQNIQRRKNAIGDRSLEVTEAEILCDRFDAALATEQARTRELSEEIQILRSALHGTQIELASALETEGKSLDFCIGLTGNTADEIRTAFKERDELSEELNGFKAAFENETAIALIYKRKRDELSEQVAALTEERDNALQRVADLESEEPGRTNQLYCQLREKHTNLEHALRESEASCAAIAKQRDDYMEESISGNNCILKLARMLGCSDGDDTPEIRITAMLARLAELEADRARLLTALEDVIASAHPNKTEHPTMFAVWESGIQAIDHAREGE